MTDKVSQVTARVERKKTNAVQRWTTIKTSPSGVSRRTHHMTRRQAIYDAANYLTVYDERNVAARAAFQKTHSEVHAEITAKLDKETEPDAE